MKFLLITGLIIAISSVSLDMGDADLIAQAIGLLMIALALPEIRYE